MLSSAEHEVIDAFSDTRSLCEVSLFARTFHTASLATASFGESLTLTGAELAACIRTQPVCVSTIYRYARFLITAAEREGLDLVSAACVQNCVDLATRSSDVDFSNLGLAPSKPRCDFQEVLASSGAEEAKDGSDVVQPFLDFFPEVEPAQGIYNLLRMESERRRSVCALSSMLLLHYDRYDLFASGQPDASRISEEQWAELQDFMRWVGATADMLHVALAFLVMRGLTKNKSVVNTLATSQRSPEQVLEIVIRCMPELVASRASLNKDQMELLHQSIRFHSSFNFAQFLQGENSPSQIAAFQSVVHAEGEEAFKVYLLQIMGVMCGIRGDENPYSSMFMDAKNVMTLTTGLRVFRHVETSSAQAVYWNFIAARAGQLSLPTDEPEHFVLARLACLCRGQQAALDEMRRAWVQLNKKEQLELKNLFLADGIDESNYVLKFLPAFLANALANPNVGMHAAMVVLVDLLEVMKTSAFANTNELQSVIVNVQDLASFTAKVSCSSVFSGVTGHMTFNETADEVTVGITSAHLQRVGQRCWFDQPAQEAATLVRRLRRQFDSFGGASASPSSGAHHCDDCAESSFIPQTRYLESTV